MERAALPIIGNAPSRMQRAISGTAGAIEAGASSAMSDLANESQASREEELGPKEHEKQ